MFMCQDWHIYNSDRILVTGSLGNSVLSCAFLRRSLRVFYIQRPQIQFHKWC